jgi:hypothetical protein
VLAIEKPTDVIDLQLKEKRGLEKGFEFRQDKKEPENNTPKPTVNNIRGSCFG